MMMEKNFAELVIKFILEFEKIHKLNINEIDRCMTYYYKTNKGIDEYKKELIDNIQLLKIKDFDKKAVIEIFEEYCDDLKLNYLLNYIFYGLEIYEKLFDTELEIKSELIKNFNYFNKKLNKKKDKIRYLIKALFLES